ncbi:MAG: heme-binding domain-containing protein [Bacteroidia bacterium]|nr:heme-binding domain-containing protein [Bacteroidia bacterium]
MKKKIILVVSGLLILIQFVRPDRNVTNDRTNDISNTYPVSAPLKSILESACNDCHSNKTNYPWYTEVQPIGWWLNYHVTDGKKHLNFSTFNKMPIAVQNHKFEEVIEMVKEGEMPLPSYTWLGLHEGANLTDAERKIIIDWAGGQMNSLKNQYPPDSLVMKRRSPPPAE